ncbi:hypothetical protein M378DRAFT_421571 [Amanita muscaria Koide BX008]|uniref:Uncharacterized protein n=1 Tax=Amanita muscaria (strain Koide BX008) TaxID=946122 RepID=A0A0C2WLN6_AMAMK|nr:hypothetical protein M378DRAFT_421571 [Amanita muscaria Koide BX008]
MPEGCAFRIPKRYAICQFTSPLAFAHHRQTSLVLKVAGLLFWLHLRSSLALLLAGSSRRMIPFHRLWPSFTIIIIGLEVGGLPHALLWFHL